MAKMFAPAHARLATPQPPYRNGIHLHARAISLYLMRCGSAAALGRSRDGATR